MTDQELFSALATFSIMEQKRMRDKAFGAHEATSDPAFLNDVKKTLIEIVKNEVYEREIKNQVNW